ncbi:hypothetical protein Adu01nite_29350 [Paractinoplanes durhamensis]|uniref:DUF427 domain-containing protein n=1 Tax=Paractinoplanes durhamensis TaxID=113563 RepID=A0ABQ3YVM1_9ACTN|nr:DUF427 domain-containing protein [Actinoplanes durhamensis]GIE01585.1 hypothetical protein Adu01nite_29350 [Actinoplanes durhamensis]
MSDYPQAIAQVNHREPVPRRIRAMLAGRVVLDTTRAVYLWEWPPYPQFYVPIDDVAADVLVDEQHEQRLSRGLARRFGLRVGDAFLLSGHDGQADLGASLDGPADRALPFDGGPHRPDHAPAGVLVEEVEIRAQQHLQPLILAAALGPLVRHGRDHPRVVAGPAGDQLLGGDRGTSSGSYL